MNRKLSLAAAMLACLSASPAAAADPNRFFHEQAERARVGGYVGLTFSFVRTAKGQPAPNLRLGMGARHLSGAAASAPFGAPRSAVELDLSAKGQPNLYFGGRRLSAARGGSGWGTGETLLVIAGVAAAVLLATQLGGSDDNHDDEQCMIEPELCD
jgi:hypothetical protein